MDMGTPHCEFTSSNGSKGHINEYQESEDFFSPQIANCGPLKTKQQQQKPPQKPTITLHWGLKSIYT